MCALSLGADDDAINMDFLLVQGWTVDRAVEYMMEQTGMQRHECEAECYRYEAWPGQVGGTVLADGASDCNLYRIMHLVCNVMILCIGNII